MNHRPSVATVSVDTVRQMSSSMLIVAFHIRTVFHNGFFFSPKTAINRRISTNAGSTLEGETDKDRNVGRTTEDSVTVYTHSYFILTNTSLFIEAVSLCSLKANPCMHINIHRHTHTNLQAAKITQYVQHSHFSNTKKDKDTDALQWTASAGCNICQGKTPFWKKKHTILNIQYVYTNLQMARIHQ